LKVGLLGGGVIGGGWAARFLLNGHDVRLYDPDPEAPRKVGEVLENARHAYSRLTYAPLPRKGRSPSRRRRQAADGSSSSGERAERIELARAACCGGEWRRRTS
jgi:carnitine 3-dehydrogenase